MIRLLVVVACFGVACKAAPVPTTTVANRPAPVPTVGEPAGKASKELLVARAWVEALGHSDRKVLAALSDFSPLYITRAEGDGTACAEEIDDADELVTQTPCLGESPLIKDIIAAHSMVVKHFDDVLPPGLDGFEDDFERLRREDEEVRSDDDENDLRFVTVSFAAGTSTDYLILGVKYGQVRHVFYDRFQGQLHAKAPRKPAAPHKTGSELVVARAWIRALGQGDTSALEAMSAFPVLTVDARNMGTTERSKTAKALLKAGMLEGLLPFGLMQMAKASPDVKVVVAPFDRIAEELPAELEDHAHEIDDLRDDHELVKITITVQTNLPTDYLLLAVRDDRVSAVFYDSIEDR